MPRKLVNPRIAVYPSPHDRTPRDLGVGEAQTLTMQLQRRVSPGVAHLQVPCAWGQPRVPVSPISDLPHLIITPP